MNAFASATDWSAVTADVDGQITPVKAAKVPVTVLPVTGPGRGFDRAPRPLQGR